MTVRFPHESADTQPPTPLPTVASLLTPERVASALGVTTKTLANWRSRGTGPEHVRIAGHVYYTHKAYAEYWNEQTGGAA